MDSVVQCEISVWTQAHFFFFFQTINLITFLLFLYELVISVMIYFDAGIEYVT